MKKRKRKRTRHQEGVTALRPMAAPGGDMSSSRKSPMCAQESHKEVAAEIPFGNPSFPERNGGQEAEEEEEKEEEEEVKERGGCEEENRLWTLRPRAAPGRDMSSSRKSPMCAHRLNTACEGGSV